MGTSGKNGTGRTSVLERADSFTPEDVDRLTEEMRLQTYRIEVRQEESPVKDDVILLPPPVTGPTATPVTPVTPANTLSSPDSLSDDECMRVAMDLYLHERYEESQPYFYKVMPSRLMDADTITAYMGAFTDKMEGWTPYIVGLLEQAVALAPHDAQIWHNLAQAYMITGKNSPDNDKSLRCIERSLLLCPTIPMALYNRATFYLARGRYEEGWRDYINRFACSHSNREWRSFTPLWNGESLPDGSTLYLWAEQGIGDIFQFVRYVKHCRTLVGPKVKIIFEVTANLLPLLVWVEGADEVVARRIHRGFNTSETVTAHAPTMHLPFVLGWKTPQDVPQDEPYISLPPGYPSALLPSREDIGGRLRVGVCWKGSPEHGADIFRSFPFEQFAEGFLKHPALTDKAVFINLQYSTGLTDEEIANAGLTKVPLRNWQETAGLIDALDLIVTVDTSICHLAGAMGKRTLLLLSNRPEWRWLLPGYGYDTTTPYYENTTLLRQTPDETDYLPLLSRAAAFVTAVHEGI